MSIQTGDYLVVFCSGADLAIPGQPMHANFKLDEDGEYLGVFDPSGQVAHEFVGGYPPQSKFHFYGWDSELNRYVYFDTPSPARKNGGGRYMAICDKPLFADRLSAFV